MFSMKIATLPISVILLLLRIQNGGVEAKTSVCYYRNWVQYRQSKARFLPEDIDPTLCSVINYAAMQINFKSHKLEGRQKNDVEMLHRLILLKKKNPALKIFISVGGWNHEKKLRFSKMVKDIDTRQTFITSVIDFLTNHNLDGVNLDWEYPGTRRSPAKDKYRFTYLLKEMLDAFEKDASQREGKRFFLTLAVSASRKKIEKAYEIKEIAKYVDWVDVMAYNLRGPWRRAAGCPTLTKGRAPNVPDTLSAWLKGGMPANKINLGLAAYGRSYRLKFPWINRVGSPIVGAGPAGEYTKKKGILAYYEICTHRWTRKTSQENSECGTPYASDGDTWVAYEDVSSIRYKISELVNKKGLNGISLWALDFDDFSGQNCNEGRYPLLTAAVEGMKPINSIKA